MNTKEHSNRLYGWIWIYLLVLTGIELLLAYRHVFAPGMMMLVLMSLSVAKAGMIMNWFMHLGSERLMLVLSLVPPLILVLSLLFGFFPDAYRLAHLRVH
jgi:caa(3)-type oxidase subunit IV